MGRIDKEELRDFYSKDYFDGGKGYHRYQNDDHFGKTASDIIKLFNPRSVLEIGCAKGFLVKALRDRGVKAYGIDISEYAINEAPEDVQDYLYVHDITIDSQMTFPDCELVISLDTFEHIPEDKLPKVWKFMKDQGREYYIKVGTLNTPDWQHDESHITMHTLEWWMNRFPDAVWEESK